MANMLQRLHEARRIGFQRCLLAAQRGAPPGVEGLAVIPIHHVREALERALEG